MQKYTGLEIAVIGMSCRFPGAATTGQFWENLCNGVDYIRDFSRDEAMQEGEPGETASHVDYVRSNGYLDNKDKFDAAFFNYRPEEAELMDPQMRIYHECCWEAIEDGGFGSRLHEQKIGLFSAGSPNLSWLTFASMKNKDQSVDNFSSWQLRDITFMSTRISYLFDLRGPAVYLQTACSSSLVAIHQACNSLLLGECSIALAGGVTMQTFSKRGYFHKEGMIFSKDGKCRPYDIDSSGTVAGEGAGVVVLKRLKDALGDRDNIYAVIKGSAVNNDGRNKVGYATPGVRGQLEVIKKAQKMAKAEAAGICYVEGHGTATEIGDPIEVEALNEAFAGCAPKSCILGSVKSNIGHLDNAAGIAGFIKAVLAIKNRKIPATLHFREANPKIQFANGPFYVNGSLIDLKDRPSLLRAGVSSFGIGGTNAHIVIEEPPEKEPSAQSRDYQLILLSARSECSLEGNTRRLIHYLGENTGSAMPDIAYTLQTGRERFKYRKMLVCENKEDAKAILADNTSGSTSTGAIHEELQRIIFMFPGQGAQYSNMSRDLYRREPIFKTKMDECFAIAKDLSSEDLSSILFPNDTDDPVTGFDITNTKYAQPLLFMVEYCLACLFMEWGITPDYMIGHSVGEYVAACLSGVFSLKNALRLVIRRGELMSQAPKGRMLSISINEDQLKPLILECEGVDLAAVNSPSSLVVSGGEADIEKILKLATQQGYQAKILHTSHAFHSRMMDETLAGFEQEVSVIEINEPKIPYVGNSSGTFVTFDEIKQCAYWSGQLRNTVQFLKGSRLLLKEGNAVFIEMGPGNTLCNYLSQNEWRHDDHHFFGTVRHSKQKIDDQRYLVERIGLLWLKGVNVKWDRFYGDEKRNKVPLPTYSFDWKSYTADLQMNFISDLSVNGKPALTTLAQMISVSGWQQSIAPNFPGELSNEKFEILVFSDRYDFSDKLIKKLRSYDQHVIEVKPGYQFKRSAEDCFELDLSKPADLCRLWDQLEGSNVIIHTIVYCSALDNSEKTTNYDNITESLNDGYLGLSYLSQSMATGRQTQPIALTVVDNHLAYLTKDDHVDPLKATIMGPSKVIPVELLNVTCKVIDIPFPHGTDAESDEYVDKLLAELFYESDDIFIAYRYNERWIRSFTSLVQREKTGSGVEIRKHGTYLITGGFGGMGFSLAKDLVYNYNANVILTHRSFFPERRDWNDWLSEKDQEDTISERIRELLRMEETGCGIWLYGLDLSDEDAVKGLVADITVNERKINGIIWAAGEVDFGGIIQNRQSADLTRYIYSKVHGVLLLEKYLSFEGLDFIALFSSIANVLYQARFGQVAYLAANEFLENLPWHLRTKYGIHAFTINWCDWLDVGMTVRTVMRKNDTADVSLVNSMIKDGITPAQGVELFHRCLHSKSPVANIYKGDLLAAIAEHRDKYIQIKDAFVTPPPPAEPSIKDKTGPQEKIIDIFREFFGNNAISPRDNFFELGGDSLKAMTLIARINKHMGISLSIKDIYTFSTIGLLIDEIAKTSAASESRIPGAPAKSSYPLSPAQNRMYFLQTMDVQSTAYNEVTLFWVKGELNKLRLANAMSRLIERHEILRTVFVFEDSHPMQKISPAYTYDIECRKYIDNNIELTIASFIRPFDLSVTPPFRVGTVEYNSDRHLMIIDMHHIITDALSTRILVRELMDLYDGEVLPPVKIQYKDYTEWLRQESSLKKRPEQRKFWLEKFSDFTILDLPTDFIRPEIKSYDGNRIGFLLEEQITASLRAIAKETGASLYMTFLSLYCILLGKLSSQEDIIVGTVTAGREHTDLENAPGMFANTLAMRHFPGKTRRFREFLLQVKADTLAYFDNQAFPYEELVDELRVPRNTSRNPLFDAFFSFYNFEPYELKIESLELESCDDPLHRSSKFDITLTVMESKEGLSLAFEYATGLFSEETIRRFITWFRQIAAAVTTNVDVRISDIDLLTAEEKARLLAAFNGTVSDHQAATTIVGLFDAQVSRTPHHTALVYEHIELTYAALNDHANRLAVCLQQRYGIMNNDLVGICMGRSEYLSVGILGILKSGGAYVPMDPDYPDDRISYIIGDTAMKAVLTDRQHAQRLTAITSIPILVIDSMEFQFSLLNQTTILPANAIRPDSLAYVIYTSGTTGRPKGVLVEHRNVTRLFNSTEDLYHFDDRDVWTLFHSFVFDFTVWELWGALLYGGKLVIPSYDQIRDLEQFYQLCLEQGVTVLNQTPSAFYQFSAIALHQPQLLDRLRYVIFGGEALNLSQLRSWFARYKDTETRLINMYGITETTVHVTYKEIKATELEKGSLIGKVLPHLSAYILDDSLTPLPMGAIGELYIGGAGVSRGYLNRPDLTEQRFITNPFQTEREKAQGINDRIYKTGDTVRYLEDGSLVYIGRNDLQVKIRGYRIELAEIESGLSLYPGITQCAVIVKEQLGITKCLVAYYASAEEFPLADLKDHLQEKLPSYMIPAFFVHLPALPLTINGKLDVKALPDPEVQIDDDYLPPTTDVEKGLSQIWVDILHINTNAIGQNTNFFNSGGDSLKTLGLRHKIRDKFQVDIDLKAFFKASTIKELGKQIEALTSIPLDKHLFPDIRKIERQDFYRTSFAQDRMLYEYMTNGESLTNNISKTFRITGELDIDRLQRAFQSLTQRHESLRTYFIFEGDSFVQYVTENIEFDLPVSPYGRYQTLKDAFTAFVRPFDPAKCPLFRAEIWKDSDDTHFLFIDIHHIICDGISLNILMNDFVNIYAGNPLAPLDLRYIDYADWQRRRMKSLTTQGEFWLSRLSGDLPRINLAAVLRRNGATNFPAKTITSYLSFEETEKVRSAARAENVSDFMYMLAIYYVLLFKISGDVDIIIGTDAAGRTHAGLTPIVGSFINVLPLRLHFDSKAGFKKVLAGVKECVLEAIENQDLQYNEFTHLPDNRSGRPVFDVYFSFTNFFENENDLQKMGFIPVEIEKDTLTARYELELNITDKAGIFIISFLHSTELYDRDTIELFLSYYRSILFTTLNNSPAGIESLELETSDAGK
jgi:iturin family lipopeptide synthetase A